MGPLQPNETVTLIEHCCGLTHCRSPEKEVAARCSPFKWSRTWWNGAYWSPASWVFGSKPMRQSLPPTIQAVWKRPWKPCLPTLTSGPNAVVGAARDRRWMNTSGIPSVEHSTSGSRDIAHQTRARWTHRLRESGWSFAHGLLRECFEQQGDPRGPKSTSPARPC